MCSDLNNIEMFLPQRRRGRRGREAGMGSKECDQRYIEEGNEKSNWQWPQRRITKEDRKKLMGAALEISVKFFFKNFTYTFGGKVYIQLHGGPIGSPLGALDSDTEAAPIWTPIGVFFFYLALRRLC